MLLLFKELNEFGKCCIPEHSWRFIMQVRIIQMLIMQTYILLLEDKKPSLPYLWTLHAKSSGLVT